VIADTATVHIEKSSVGVSGDRSIQLKGNDKPGEHLRQIISFYLPRKSLKKINLPL
jgi:hypothetical protein